MTVSDTVINRYGTEIFINRNPARGFIASLDAADPQKRRVPLSAGVKNVARYRLITNRTVREGDGIVCGGREYEVLSAEKVTVFGAVSHIEAMLREKGGCGDV